MSSPSVVPSAVGQHPQEQHQQQEDKQEEKEGVHLAEWLISECLTDGFFVDTWEKRFQLWRGDTLKNNKLGHKFIDPVNPKP